MTDTTTAIMTGNEAAAYIAHKVNEVCVIYPITPSTEMAEIAEARSAEGQKNIFGDVPSVMEMQGENGVAGALHGALQAGSMATTFTASQGLLLMLPNLYKIAGELTPNVIHVATRSIATHALSVFGDHSDIMAVRQSGYAILGATTVQETMDMALIAQAASLSSRIPFIHHFDGFRTSHESAVVEPLEDAVIEAMIDRSDVDTFRLRALDPERPVIRGTSQGPDTFFQAREAVSKFYEVCPAIVQEKMDRYAELTGRQYHTIEYHGHPEAETVVVAMGSAVQTLRNTIQDMNANGGRAGLLHVRLYRPFDAEAIIDALPATCRRIAVLDRTKEAGAGGEPLYSDILKCTAIAASEGRIEMPAIIGGRYGLSSRDLTPDMAAAVIRNANSEFPVRSFTVGICDDVNGSSLLIGTGNDRSEFNTQAIIQALPGRNGECSHRELLEILAEDGDHVQAYKTLDYRKSDACHLVHIRTCSHPFQAPYEITGADFIGCRPDALRRMDLSGLARRKAILALYCKDNDELKNIPDRVVRTIRDMEIETYIVRADPDQDIIINGSRVSPLQACYLQLTGKAGPASEEMVIERFELAEVRTKMGNRTLPCQGMDAVIEQIALGVGHHVPVSRMPVDGTWPTGTSRIDPANRSSDLADRVAVLPEDAGLSSPLFDCHSGLDNSGEAVYLNLLSRLFGDRLLIANATGSSSIFCGALPTTPWLKDAEGRGPAWSNSLFEDNAEFGLGFRLALDQRRSHARGLLLQLKDQLFKGLVNDILFARQDTRAGIQKQRSRIEMLRDHLEQLDDSRAQELLKCADDLVDRSVWCVGGDGWAYDIGFGGLDHVLASGRNVNILVLDNEAYSNTGGQVSKATPYGAKAKCASNGKQTMKKDLGRIAMQYGNVYVASIAIGADPDQAVRALSEAERHEGPSLVIAYCPAPAHGIDMQEQKAQYEAAVESGQWLMYRHDPMRDSRGLPALQLDCGRPTIALTEYLQSEGRFSDLTRGPDVINAISQVERRREIFESMAIQERESAHCY